MVDGGIRPTPDYFLSSQERGGSNAALKRRSFARRRAGDIFVTDLGQAVVSRLAASIDALVSRTCRQSLPSALGNNSASRTLAEVMAVPPVAQTNLPQGRKVPGAPE